MEETSMKDRTSFSDPETDDSEFIQPEVCTLPYGTERLIGIGLSMIQNIVNPFIYRLVYEDVVFFYNLLTSDDLEFLKPPFKLFSNASVAGYETITGFEDNTILHAGYNFLDLMRISNQLDNFLLSFVFRYNLKIREIVVFEISVKLLRANVICMLTNNSVLNFILKSVPSVIKGDTNAIKDDIKDKLTKIINNLTVDKWAEVCERLQIFLERPENEELKQEIASLTSLKKVDGRIIDRYYPDPKITIFNDDTYDYYLEMSDRFNTRQLNSVLSTTHYDENGYESRVKIRDFLQWLKNVFLKSNEIPVPHPTYIPPKRLVSMPENGIQTEEFKESVIGNQNYYKPGMIKQITELYEDLVRINKKLCNSYCEKWQGWWIYTKKQCVQNSCVLHPFRYLNNLKNVGFGSDFGSDKDDKDNKELKRLVSSEIYKTIERDIVTNKFFDKLKKYDYEKLRKILILFTELKENFEKLHPKSYTFIVKHVKTQKKRGGRTRKKRARKKYN